MEETTEEPPTSAVFLDDRHFSQVIFNSMEKFYIPGGDITCYYSLTQHFVPRRKDWIGIFRVGWKTTREYYTFMWAPLPTDLNQEAAKQQEVRFKAYYLPKDDEYYQFCYVDQDGVIRGASVPFQFRPESEEDILVVTSQGEVEEIEQENKELRKENQELKDSCASLQKQSSDQQAELQKKQDELEALKSTKQKLEQEVQEQQDCWEAELLLLKEQNLKLTSENEKLGIRVDRLQVQLSTQEKEKEKLVQEDQDKTRQLEYLKKENEELFLSLTKQRDHYNKLELTVQEMKRRESTAVSKHQAIMDENFDLSRRLSENQMICDVLQREKERLERENDLLKRENHRLLSYMGLDCESLSAEQNLGLAFGNPYSGIQESSDPGLKCNVCKPDAAEEFFDHALEQQQLQNLCLNCPVCNKIFSVKEQQVFEDHVFCHSL
ncbi:calcium-binding and coiled-coil domain-containing protein 2 [Sorex araneus]|uniref:calcium-binding and coiled-coil domain-containing protein 2 n=1 Tax=Sorex araneus TaxID=42254 RepID=UPI002433B234|nr:calcium-binding and coiled-coil domain-containing protein 2 [Sorex araneus]